ncbi:GNAT family N-acetyltransferase [Microbacterium sediminis]|uniref:GCN5 family acetyltransferase n=1 Tax=Microbacterium sediminis TaxID=904291 RepID=A0A1B9NIU2_9MICO|nr:GNAT family N-acetyltransferase [Microbacterium sediminis]OCG76522.1 GCN5 family acetyltransferase [Microbacterium sediminis]QBR73874.1 GNAT family N-acetyltransferase [Microbacterium sediminis]
MTLSLRIADPSDVPAIVSLVESAYRGEASRAGWTTEADLLDGQRTDADQVSGLLGPGGSVVLLAERDGAPVACCHLEHRGDHAYFGMFAVDPRAQAGGIGRAVLAEAERFARAEWSVSQLRMTVITAREDLIAWYERRGYRRTGEHSPFPYGDERFGIPRRDDLAFETLVKPLGVAAD